MTIRNFTATYYYYYYFTEKSNSDFCCENEIATEK